MMVRRMLVALALTLAAAPVVPPARAGEGVPPVTVPRSEVHDLVSTATGKPYRLMLWRPAGPPPAQGWPVIYLLDANSRFGTVTDILDTRARRPEVTGMGPAVVVGLAYPTEDPYDVERRMFDLTPPAPAYALEARPNGQPWPALGGADAFLRFIEDDVKPFVGGRLPLDDGREVLVGHSFGGLFALHVLFTRPAAFDAYVATSPSIWFNDRHVMGEAQAFLANRRPDAAPIQLEIGVGGLEQSLSRAEQALPDADRRLAWKARNAMIDNARSLSEVLRAAPALAVSLTEFAGEDHASIVPVHLSHALGRLLASAQDGGTDRTGAVP